MDQTPNLTLPPVADIRPRKFTVAEYHRMAEVGILGPGGTVQVAALPGIELPVVRILD